MNVKGRRGGGNLKNAQYIPLLFQEEMKPLYLDAQSTTPTDPRSVSDSLSTMHMTDDERRGKVC